MKQIVIEGNVITYFQDAFVLWTNTDLTEGRGVQKPLAVCESEATAIRLGKKNGVMGSDCEITKVNIFRFNNMWYGPVHLITQSIDDKLKQNKIDAKNKAIAKAKAAGLTEDDIKALL